MELHPILEPGNKPLFNLWYVISSVDSPSQRVGQACVFEREKKSFYVLGGADPSGAYDDIYKLDLISQRWTKLILGHFTARYEHCALQPTYAAHKIYLFGGANQSDNLNSIQVIDTSSNLCETVKCGGSPPSPRTLHSAAFDGDLLYVWGGGHKGSTPVNDIQLHVFNCANHTWMKPTVKGKVPSARHGHVMAVIDKSLYIHGGMSGSTFHKDMHAINLESFSCSKIKQRGTPPCARAAHACCSHDELLFIFGGMSPEKALDDMYHFNTVNQNWTKISFESPPPTPRLDHSMIFAYLPYIETSNPDGIEVCNGSDVHTSTPTQPACSETDPTRPNIIPVDLWSSSSGIRGETMDAFSSLTLNAQATPSDYVPVCIVFGGMDESGNFFDDVLLCRIDSPSSAT